MTILIQELQQAISQHHHVHDACVRLQLTFPLVAWVDDVAIPLVTSRADQLGDLALWALQETVRISASFGLQLNLQPQKTEAVVAFRGADAPRYRQACYDEAHGHLCSPAGDLRLRCVPCYEHLGTFFVAEGKIGAELQHRVSRATQAHHQVRRAVLHNRHISCATRLKLFEALIMPILLHGAGNWPLLNHPQLTRLHGLYLKWLRSIIGNGFWAADMVNDQLLLFQWGLPTITLRLAKLRLLFAFYWERDCPLPIVDVVTAASSAGQSWFVALRHSLTWLRSMDADSVPWDPQIASVECIMAWLRAHREDGPRLVRRSYKRALRHGRLMGRVIAAHCDLHRCFGPMELCADRVHVSLGSDGLQHECRVCAKSFSSLTALHTHQWLAHEIISEERQMMSSTTCDACHQCFWTSQRLQQHLRYSRRHRGGCYERLTWWKAPHVSVPDIEVTCHQHRFHRRPAVHVSTACTADEIAVNSREAALDILQRHWNEADLPLMLDPAISHEVRARLDQALTLRSDATLDHVDDLLLQLFSIAEGTDVSREHGDHGEWALCLWILDSLRFSRFPALSVALFQRLDQELREFLRQSLLGRLLCWQRRMDQAYQPVQAVALEDAEKTDARPVEMIVDPCAHQLSILSPVFDLPILFPSSVGVPLGWDQGKPVLWILHLFSGRRRIGDCHWWLSCIGPKILPQYTIRLLSVDTAIHPHYGDLSSGDNLRKILAMAKRGLFSATMTGPPCETFSAARGIELDQASGPRPLRTAAQPWMLPSRTHRELAQCETGSELLFNSLQVEVTVVGAGGGSMMEHPEMPADEDKVSVWRLRCHRDWVMGLRDACRHRIEQWLFGAIGIKPTCLRAINLGPPVVVGRALAEGAELWRTKPSQGLKGRASDGRFRTAGAKEYPSALCRSLVVSVLKGLQYRIAREGVRPPVEPTVEEQHWLDRMCAASEVLAHGTFLPDYQGA
eukprot:s1283_g25.t1